MEGEIFYKNMEYKKGMYMWLGHITTLIDHGILIQQANIPCMHFPLALKKKRHEPQLLASIHMDVDHVVNLDDPNVWV
jgi:hypothetical protein